MGLRSLLRQIWHEIWPCRYNKLLLVFLAEIYCASSGLSSISICSTCPLGVRNILPGDPIFTETQYIADPRSLNNTDNWLNLYSGMVKTNVVFPTFKAGI